MTTSCSAEHILHQQYLKILQLNSAATRLEHEASCLRAIALQLEVILDDMKARYAINGQTESSPEILQ